MTMMKNINRKHRAAKRHVHSQVLRSFSSEVLQTMFGFTTVAVGDVHEPENCKLRIRLRLSLQLIKRSFLWRLAKKLKTVRLYF